MAHRKSRLKLKHQDLSINVDIRTKKLDPEALEEEPEIIRRDRQSGDLVIRQLYDRESGEALEDGYGYRWITEEGEEVSSEDIALFVVEDDEERAFSKHEPTVGSDRTLTAETWIPVATLDEYLVERVYECWGEEDIDIAQLHELATHIRDFDEAPVVPFVMQPSHYKKWGILTPIFYDDTFAMLIRVTSRKIDPDHRMEPITPEEVEIPSDVDEDVKPLEQESPFG